MAWIKGLAYKAEDLLNKIDKNAAEALQQDKARKAPSENNWDDDFASEQMNGTFVRSDEESAANDASYETVARKTAADVDAVPEGRRSASSTDEADDFADYGTDGSGEPSSERLPSAWTGDDKKEPSNSSLLEQNLLKQELGQFKQRLEESEGTLRELRKELENSRNANRDLRADHDHYKIRAQRILNEKEHIISELRKGAGVSQNFDEATVLELKAMRQEREFLREENAQITSRLKALRDELLEAEKRFDSFRDQAAEVQRGLLSNLETERVSRQAAEEDCKAHAEELRGMRSDIAKQRSALMSKLQDREAELTRLRTQLSQKLSPQNAELGSRLQMLTNTLIQKQNTLETILTERNGLRLQLETLEKKYREALNGAQQSQSRMIPISNGDDGRSHIPSMFIETPFDTTMTRRVKKAYSSLDAVSIRTGVFLRRYPLARIVVFSYVVLLHLWVMFVLLSNSPQS